MSHDPSEIILIHTMKFKIVTFNKMDFYCIFDPIYAALVSRKDFLKKNILIIQNF